MANPIHLAKLNEGAEAWNAWRDEVGYGDEVYSEGMYADLRGAELRNRDLRGMNFRTTDLSGADLSGSDLREIIIRGDGVIGVTFTNTILNGADLRGVRFGKLSLKGTKLNNAKLDEANFDITDFFGVDLRGAQFNKATLTDSTFAYNQEVHPNPNNLSKAQFGYASLRDVAFQKTDLSEASFYEADVEDVKFNNTLLNGCYFRDAVLKGATFASANFANAHLGRTAFFNVDLSQAIGLEECNHSGPSGLDYLTMLRSGNLPLSFYRGCGLPETFIEYLPSLLLQEPIQFYSCFISYSTKDDEFAKRLHADLQNSGVRCWFAPKDVQGGRKLHEQLDEAIRIYERLLLILSDHSMNSEWVKTEIANARQKEASSGQRVLFPIRLVDFSKIRAWQCFDADTGKDTAREIREYYIPDFSGWKDHDRYKGEFEKLLRDIKPDVVRH